MEKARPLNFESLDEPELAQMLRQFYAEVRTKSGNPYSTSGMRNIRASIQRHLTAPPYNRAINIITDRNFQVSNTIFKAQVWTLRVEGKDITKHKPVIEKEDMTKITSNLKTDNPVGLQQRVFIDLMLHFGRKGREGLMELKRESFVITKGAGVCEYVELAYNEMEKKPWWYRCKCAWNWLENVCSGWRGLPSEKPEIIFESLKCQVQCLLSETKQKLLDHWKMVWQCSFRDPHTE